MALLDFLGFRKATHTPVTPDGIVTLGLDDGSLMPNHVASGVFKQSAPPERGSVELLALYRTSPWLRAATHKIAGSFASIRWTAYARTSPAGKFIAAPDLVRADHAQRRDMIRRSVAAGELKPLHGHPLDKLMERPNPLMTGQVMRHVCQVHLDLLGEAFIVLDTNAAGMPIRMWPIPPTWIKELPSEKSPAYRVEIDGTVHSVPMTNMLTIRDPNPSNPYGRSTGLGHALADEIDIDEFASKHVASWFHNKGMPDMLISLEGAAKPALENAKRAWDSAVRGFAKAYRTHWTGAKLDVKRLDTAFKDMALIDIRTFERNSIVQVFGVPPEKLGIIDNSNRSTSQAAHYIFANDVLVPRCELWRNELQERLASRFDERIVIDYESPIPVDREFQRSIIQTFSDVFTIDEIRSLADMDPLPEGKGKAFLVMPTRSYVTDLSTMGSPPIYGYHLAAGVLTNNEVRSSLRLEPTTEEWGDDRAVGMYIDPNMLMGGSGAGEGLPPEVQLANSEAMAKAAAATKQRALGAPVRRTVSLAKIEAALNAVQTKALSKRVDPVLRALLQEWGKDTLKALGYAGDFDMNAPDVDAHLREYAADRLGRLINTTTRDELDTALRAVLDEGGDKAAARDAVRSVFDRAEVERSDMIAETEVRRSSMFATKEAMSQSGVVIENEWLSTMDGRSREEHLSMDGQRRALDKPFEVTVGRFAGAKAMHPGSFGIGSLDINCRCAIAPVMVEQDDDTVPSSTTASARKSGIILTTRMTEGERAEVWRSLDRKATAWDARYARAIAAGFRDQERAVLDALDDE